MDELMWSFAVFSRRTENADWEPRTFFNLIADSENAARIGAGHCLLCRQQEFGGVWKAIPHSGPFPLTDHSEVIADPEGAETRNAYLWSFLATHRKRVNDKPCARTRVYIAGSQVEAVNHRLRRVLKDLTEEYGGVWAAQPDGPVQPLCAGTTPTTADLVNLVPAEGASCG